MATMSQKEAQSARNALERSGPVNTYSREQINAWLQAIEDAMVTTTLPAGAVCQTVAQYLSGVINAATSPVVLTAAQKKLLFAHCARLKFERDR